MSKILDMMLFEFRHNIRNGIYGYTQKMMAYNSNRIEGSKLSIEHTSNLFDTQSIEPYDIYRMKDVEEMNGHFLMFNYMLKTIDKPLTEELIKQFHKCLKQGVFEDRANGYPIGEYKSRENIIGTYNTVKPSEVHKIIDYNLRAYNSQAKTIDSILAFHVAYEIIHPFQDGNGRTGRLILFRECLVNNIEPFIIRDENKIRYLNALTDARKHCNINMLRSYIMEEQEYYHAATKGML